MKIQLIEGEFSVCKLPMNANVRLDSPFCFYARTDDEISLVCLSDYAPANALKRDDGWRVFRVPGTLDFSLVGILSRLSGILADAGVAIFALSTFDTDYILIRKHQFARALAALSDAGIETL